MQTRVYGSDGVDSVRRQKMPMVAWLKSPPVGINDPDNEEDDSGGQPLAGQKMVEKRDGIATAVAALQR